MELECDNANWERIREGKLDDWELVDDATLENGSELKSPKLRDTKEAWQDLKNMCELLSRYSEIGKHCGSHVHIGKQAFGIKNESFINFMKLWSIYEPIIFRFTYGEFLGPRPFFTIVSKSISRYFVDMCKYAKKENIDDKDFLVWFIGQDDAAIRFKHWFDLKTFEFRCPNGTLNPIIWQNNANVFMKMVLYSGSGRFASGLIDEKMERLFLTHLSDSEVHADYAIEFADLVFDNNLDKIYFLRQYLKDFEKGGQYVKAKPFTQAL